MKIENVEISGLESSMVASGYPMQADLTSVRESLSNLKYWSNSNILDLFLKESKKVKDIELKEDYARIKVKRKSDNTVHFFDVDFIDIELFLLHKWNVSQNGYLKNENAELFHRMVMKPVGEECVDHIDRNKSNNRRSNFRICTRQENTMNSGLSKNNSSGVTGVSFRKDKNKWRAYIFYNGEQITLGHFKEKDEAIVARLLAEVEYFKEFSPQKHLFEEYGVEFNSENKEVKLANLKSALRHYKRMLTLGNTKKGSGHDQALTGINVAFDLTFTNKAWVELERYRFIYFISSQSTMHRISKFDLRSQYNQYVDGRIIDIMEELKDTYNKTNDSDDYLRLLYSNPAGFNLTARLTTNYRSLKTVYSQRKQHRLPEWREFCTWCESLPMFLELTQK